MIEIRSRRTGEILKTVDADTLLGADLESAYLESANLTGADLRGAKLHGANLSNADMSNADLQGAILSGADLNEATLEHAYFANTTLAHCSTLHLAKGLETIHHQTGSTLDVVTLRVCVIHLPDVFLRGVGYTNDEIGYLRSFYRTHPIEFYSCFISYNHTDKSFARRLHDALQGRGISCWLDEHQVLPGDNIYEAVDRGVRYWDKVLLCCSEHSLTSWWVDNEVATAFEKEQKLQKDRGKPVHALIPLNLDGYLFQPECRYAKAGQLRQRLAADFTGWETDNAKFEEQFKRVVKALRADAAARPEPPASKL